MKKYKFTIKRSALTFMSGLHQSAYQSSSDGIITYHMERKWHPNPGYHNWYREIEVEMTLMEALTHPDPEIRRQAKECAADPRETNAV
jgi:hypothetical protein